MAVGTTFLTDTLAAIRARLQIVAGSVLKEQDRVLLCEALVMRLALLNDLTTGSPTQSKTTGDWYSTIKGLHVLDVELYSSTWKRCREIITSDEFLRFYPDALACQQQFKRAADASPTHLYGWIVNAVLALMEGDDWFWRVNQFIVFDTKLNLDSLDLSSTAFADYIDFEQGLPNKGEWRTSDGKGDRLLNTVIWAARRYFGTFDLADYPFRPSHGNGATAEVPRAEADAWHKNRYFIVDEEIIAYMRHRVPDSDWHEWFYVPRRGLDRTCVVQCVPKSMTKNRTISKEPTTLQYLQQDFFRAMDDFFRSHLSGYIDLHDQTTSRYLAQVGSADGSYATFDLSSASDSVTLDHVDTIFGGLPIHYPLTALRSTHALLKSDTFDERRIRLNKLCGMGNGYCFPAEICVFFAILAGAIRLQVGRWPRVGDLRLYGDDIIVRQEYAESCRLALIYFGFDVNSDKSFWDTEPGVENQGAERHRFREACGIEAFDGVDITPLRLSRRLKSLTMNSSTRLAGEGVGMIDLVNRAFLFNYPTLRDFLVRILDRYKWFRTCRYLSISDYNTFVEDIRERRPSSIWVTLPFVITPDESDTQWRCFGSRTPEQSRVHETEARVTVCVAGKPASPPQRGPFNRGFISKESRRWQTRLDSNDYFSWTVNVVTKPDDQVEVDLDATGIVTIRARDLKWSEKWVPVPRPPIIGEKRKSKRRSPTRKRADNS